MVNRKKAVAFFFDKFQHAQVSAHACRTVDYFNSESFVIESAHFYTVHSLFNRSRFILFYAWSYENYICLNKDI